MGIETKEKSVVKKKRKTTTKKKEKKESTTIDLYESIRQVIKDKNKRPLTQNQVMKFLSGVITGEIVDSLTKRGASTNDKISASKLLLEEYRKEEISKREQQEIDSRNASNSSSTEITKELLFELNNRKVEGVEEVEKSEVEQQEIIEVESNDLQQ